MRPSMSLTFALLVGLTAPSLAQSAQLKPLRSLTFDVTYSLVSTSQRRISGLARDNLIDPVVGSTTFTQSFGVDDSGTMKVEVVAATADRGLVVDVSYDGKKTKQLPQRVAILPSGQLGYDLKNPICDQVAEVLPLLSRGLLLDREIAEGATWSEKFDGQVSEQRTYRVMRVSGTDATFEVETDMLVRGPDGFDGHETGTLDYATDKQVPRRWDVQLRTHRDRADVNQITDTHLVATLTSDSFAQR